MYSATDPELFKSKYEMFSELQSKWFVVFVFSPVPFGLNALETENKVC
jgi:hypothetical protein